MGMIRVELAGSFPRQVKTVSAMKGGHAKAVAETIAWLSNEVLPKAVEQDHALQAEGHFPEDRFGLADKTMNRA
jgi:mRNA-degrading endonuclease YafQ of YafQ-DinJ toxin-antitoxin module